MRFSFIIPLYNRPDEIQELLESLLRQKHTNFETVIVEDGSTIRSEEVIRPFREKLDIKYFEKKNEGQGFTRNYGMQRASGDYFIILDSDCILPEHYLESVEKALEDRDLDLFGGPDAAHASFTDLQKAISYSMTSFFTTGGIRGKKKQIGPYHPRSFNMGLSRAVFEKTGGFKITRMGEDIEWSIRIIESGFKSGFIEDAYVYHKRRTDIRRFFKQIYFFGRARINIASFYPSELKIVHFFPALFFTFFLLSLLTWAFFPSFGFLLPLMYFIYTVLIFGDSLMQTKSPKIAFLSVITSWVQLSAYAMGFLYEFWKQKILGRKNDINYYPQ